MPPPLDDAPGIVACALPLSCTTTWPIRVTVPRLSLPSARSAVASVPGREKRTLCGILKSPVPKFVSVSSVSMW